MRLVVNKLINTKVVHFNQHCNVAFELQMYSLFIDHTRY